MLEPIFQDKNWIIKWLIGLALWIGGSIILIPILWLYGFLIKCARYGYRGENKLPEFFEDIGKEAIDGILFIISFLLISIVVCIISGILAAIVVVVLSAILNNYSTSFVIGIIVFGISGIIVSLSLLYCLVGYFVEGNIKFDLGKMVSFAIKQIIPFVIFILTSILIITAPLGAYYYWYQLGKIYKEINESN